MTEFKEPDIKAQAGTMLRCSPRPTRPARWTAWTATRTRSTRPAAAGLAERVRVWDSPLEKLTVDRPYDVIVNNISMHECRDIDQVTRNVKAALAPGGWFVISDFPFPDDDGLRTVPGRLMSGIQVFEAQIDDQLLPGRTYDDLLGRHGFADIGFASISPMHALTWGRAA
jgi:SAM-dependent methyltransferase